MLTECKEEKQMSDAINNSYQILQEFSQKSKAYKPPLPRKRQLCSHYRGRSGKVKQFTEEEVFLFKCRRAASKLKNLIN